MKIMMKLRMLWILLILAPLPGTYARAQSSPTLNLEGVGGAAPVLSSATPGNGCSAGFCQGSFNAMLSGQLAGPVDSQPLTISLQVQLPVPTPASTPASTSSNVNADPTSSRVASSKKPPTLKQQVKQLEQQVQSLLIGFQGLQQEVLNLQEGIGGSPAYVAGCYPASGSGTFEGSQYSVGFDGMFCSSGVGEELAGTIDIVAEPPSAENETWAIGSIVASGALHVAFPGNPVAASGPMVVSIVGAVGQIPAVFP